MRYTAEHLEFLKIEYASKKVEDVAAAFNEKFGTSLPVTAIKSTLENHSIKCGRKHADRLIKHSRLINPEQEAFLINGYKTHPLSEVAVLLNNKFGTNFTQQQLKTYITNHDITSGRTGCFKKSDKPWNTGTKGLIKPNSGNFKKGSLPPNLKPLGHERLCSKDGFILIKIAEKNPYTKALTRYKHKHVHVWEQNYGPIPEGKVVAFKDGNKLNCDKENLMLISRAELLRLNQYGYKDIPKELQSSYLALAKLEVKTFSLSKENNSIHPRG